MLMFPTSFEGTIRLEALEPAQVDMILYNIEQALRIEEATSITRAANKICFRVGIFRLVSGGNPLNQVTHGEIEVLPGPRGLVRYRFSCVRLLILTTIVTGVMGLAARWVVPFVGGWLWLFGLSYLVGTYRVPRFMQRAADGHYRNVNRGRLRY